MPTPGPRAVNISPAPSHCGPNRRRTKSFPMIVRTALNGRQIKERVENAFKKYCLYFDGSLLNLLNEATATPERENTKIFGSRPDTWNALSKCPKVCIP